MSESLLMPNGLLNAPGPDNASKVSESTETERANKDKLPGQSKEDEIPRYQQPTNKQSKVQRQGQGKGPANRNAIDQRTWNTSKQHHSHSAKDKISQAEQAIAALKRHTEEILAQKPYFIGLGSGLEETMISKDIKARVHTNFAPKRLSVSVESRQLGG